MLVFWLSFLKVFIGIVAYLFAIIIFDLIQIFILLFEEGGVNFGYWSMQGPSLTLAIAAFATTEVEALIFS